MKDLQFPVGISNFEKIREGGYYYIDKTNLISELLSGGIAEVTLITRPRRFGKSLGMSTLANFLDIRKDSKQMFEGLAISKNTELCKKWMNQCPVVFFSFKDTDGLTFESAYGMLCMKLAFAFQDYQFLLDDAAISDDDKGIFKRILGRTASMDETKSCFLLLTRMLEIHFKKSALKIRPQHRPISTRMPTHRIKVLTAPNRVSQRVVYTVRVSPAVVPKLTSAPWLRPIQFFCWVATRSM